MADRANIQSSKSKISSSPQNKETSESTMQMIKRLKSEIILQNRSRKHCQHVLSKTLYVLTNVINKAL